jgi:hypothetical protein
MSRTNEQDVENGFPLRSRIVQTLNVPQRVRLGPSLAAALPEDRFEHPEG